MATIKKSKALAAGVSKKSPKAPMVDPKGAYTKVQQRTLGNMKKGGKIKKAQNGILEYTYPGGRAKVRMDTTGYSSGATRFPTKITRDTKSYGPSFGGLRPESNFATTRKGAEEMIEATQGKREKPEFRVKRLKDLKPVQKKTGGKVSVAKDGKWIQKATASIKKRGTEGVCTGKKFGGPTCKPGSKRYNLAKVFKGMAKKKK